ncbi:hypothetical protein HOP50_02g10680 [Chloropicon primus]|uniref:Uncharacterized protein n=1 Tax=Chloropicon primus TaxID=1764295 RepID=A0A5B8MEH0_9CHLO|nr:hypothetical protein A3770_02p10820 [Chloropicon primus]UPQ97773.1 hypothetical protein HOP50_02g10680 [Chloropicon primus]|mmetsp:Transcript_18396/g.38204  ORF Transcript_18396/g.38204 Transcript_18396/m.38204 type:complete len:92 (-) Transcript_18396:942-1217(-)|eukprot:QDZ18564.1 hypothetical protein A3770_02p10820 [Chloropicon primus]
MSYFVPSVEAPLPRGIGKPSTEQLSRLIRAERELENRKADVQRLKGRTKDGQGQNNRGPLPPLGLRTYPNRQGVTVQSEEDEMDLGTELEQ